MIIEPTEEWSAPIAIEGPAILCVNDGAVLVAYNLSPASLLDGIEMGAGGFLMFGAVQDQTVRLRSASPRPARVFIGPWWSA